MPDRVHVHRHDDYDAKSPAERWARATVTLGDGRVAASEPCEARDNPTSPLSDIETKYRQLTAPVLGKRAGPSSRS
ncbi:MmgE/PrpD family protein [Salinicola acroporae]|uniref:MmgE/PrpD family protein n=1 Tax=Salinicola acroporae TaxID=1541440 RepID=UPI0013A67130|nr:MmgE/PrpD family protein [Salinicola acroporae]